MNRDRTDLLLHRIVERQATPEDWDAFEQLAELDPSLWPELGATLRDDCHLHQATAPMLTVADRVQVPAAPIEGNARSPSGPAPTSSRRPAPKGVARDVVASVGPAPRTTDAIGSNARAVGPREASAGQGPKVRFSMRSPWPAWCAAALLAVALFWPPTPPAPNPVPHDDGSRIVGELPRLLVDAQPLAGGATLRVVSMRRVIEESIVDRAIRVVGEGGDTPVAEPLDLIGLATPREY